MIPRKRKWSTCATALLSLAAAGAFAAPSPDPPPVGFRPPLDTPEGGLWGVMDRIEADIKVSPALVRDEALNSYMRKILCDMAGPQCESLRLYIVEEPSSNAFAGPNGVVVLWTGLLLRIQSEAELAFVLSHEITHYLKRHSVANFERTTNAAGRVRLLSVATLGIAAIPAALVSVGALASYSREQEREADEGGFDLVVAKGYDPRQGSAFMADTAEERDARSNRGRELPYLSTHPNPEQRLAAINQRAARLPQDHANVAGTDPYRAAIAAHRIAWMEQEFARGDPAQSLVVVNQLLKAEPGSAELRYFLGEAYRRRNGTGDVEQAITAYREAIRLGGAPGAVHRGLGLVALKAGQRDLAKEAFQNYLAGKPEAEDRAMVQFYLNGIGGSP